jgi:DNA-binding transcriptional MerR regulator
LDFVKETYTIGEVAKMFNLSVPTLRYYDQEGLIPNLHKDSAGHRQFDSQNIDAVQIIECLKDVDMPLKDIKRFMEWNLAGDSTLKERLALFEKLDKQVNARLKRLTAISRVIDYKQRYYRQAVADGTEKYVAEHKQPLTTIIDE